ncbi:hypothetical protein [Kitasatospora azatica]|uniref:hypothetical protein n=1 Tax=Kitasatospora azatica TaxID=58347 RepID=UPI000692227B|nr:hypothetical protein [Kitasatospora azatica]
MTVDQIEAAHRCEALLDQTLDAVRPALTWQHGVPAAGEGELGWFVSRNRNVLTVVSAARRGALLGVVERHWRRTGHPVTSVNADPVLPGLYAATADGYRLALDFGTAGNAYLTVLSPPVAPAAGRLPHPPGTPGIARHPGTHADMAPIPSVHCPFWSAKG